MVVNHQVGVTVVLAIANVIDQYQTLLALESPPKPCHFYDTVNITNAVQFPNGSYLHSGVMYPPHLVGIYDYNYYRLHERIAAEPHTRGCLCRLIPCTRLCCPLGTFLNHTTRECETWIRPLSLEINITRSGKDNHPINITNEFGITYGLPCPDADGYFLDPQNYGEADEWKTYPDGRIKVLSNGKYFNKNKYCYSPNSVDLGTTFIMSPFICFADAQEPKIQEHYIKGLTIWASAPFMVITIIIYTIIPELRNLHGKCLRCHLLGMVIGGCLLAYSKYRLSIRDEVLCSFLAYTSYFFLLTSFFWLNVISFDLWWNFRGTTGINRYNDRRKFLFYSLYSWGSPLLFTIIAASIQHAPNIPLHFKIGIGEGSFCFIAGDRWIQLFYFFGPLMIIIISNSVMFIMTAVKIHKVQKEMSNIIAKNDSRKNLENEKDRIGLFARLFIVMGIPWLAEAISWMAGSHLVWLFYVTDTLNALQGVVIFFLFVVKKKVKDLIVKRYRTARGLPVASSQHSTRTTSNNYTTTSLCQNPSVKIDQGEKALISEPKSNNK